MRPAPEPDAAPPLLIAAAAELALYATEDFDIDDLLRRLGEVATGALAVDGFGVMGSDGAHTRFVHASPPLTGLERLQETLQQGPCVQAIRSGAAVTTAHPDQMRQWPDFHREALVAGIGSLLVVPLIARGRSWGTLDLYRASPGDWSAAEIAATGLLANLAVSYVVMAADRSQARQAEELLALKLLHDPLTGLPNRVLALQLVEHALIAAPRHRGLLTVLYLDIDRFKAINDRYGHQAGDEVLKTVAHRMAATLRASDTVARLAGDEFLILCEDLPHADTTRATQTAAVTAVTQRLHAAVSTPIPLPHTTMTITLSIGAVISSGHTTARTLIHDADLTMYRAKTSGRNQTIIHQTTPNPPDAQPRS